MNRVQYNKEHYRAFKVDLKKDEIAWLEKMLKEDKITKASFLRLAISEYIAKREKKNG